MSILPLRASERAAAALAGLELAAAAWVARQPDGRRLPIHFNLHGEVDRFAGPGEVALGMLEETLAALALVAVIGATLRNAAAPGGRARGLGLAQAIVVATAFCLVALHAATAFGLGDPGRLVVVGLAMILLAAGSLMGRVPPNAFVGVRTPWSLSSRLAWDRANRLAGRLLAASGVVGLAAALFAPTAPAMSCLVVAVLLAGLVASLESWRVWRSDPERRPV